MTNIYYLYSFVWIIILFLYSLGWSDLCQPLSFETSLFIIISILISLVVGYLDRKKLKYRKLEKDIQIKTKYIIGIILFFSFEIFLSRSVPVLSVINGVSYNEVDFQGITLLHNIVSSIAIVYSFYLSYVFCNYRKNKKALIHNVIILSIFIVLMQRQNILVIILVFINFMICEFRQKKHNYSLLRIMILILFVLIVLYGFGVFGNIRYGDVINWNNTSMIEKLSQINANYPFFLPKQYAWTYIYVVGPLVNLNYNITHITYSGNIFKFIMEFIPDFIKLKLNYVKDAKLLPVSSLTASTAYTFVYRYAGILGMMTMFTLYMLIIFFIIRKGYKQKSSKFMTILMCLMYFLIFSFFTNTIAYTTTSMILIISVFLLFKFKIKVSIRGEKNDSK